MKRLKIKTLERESWIAPIVEKMVKTMFRWFGHVKRRHVDSAKESRSDGGESNH